MNLEAIINIFTQIVSALTVVADVFLLLAFLFWLLNKLKIFSSRALIKFKNWLAPRALNLIFVFSGAAVLGSLFYSELAGLAPCPLCWYQRIFMYSIPVVAAVGLWRRKPGEAMPYVLVLAILGAATAFYHALLQLGLTPELLPCSNAPGAVLCAKAEILEFGYVTITAMSLTVFLTIMALALLGLKRSSNSRKV